MGTASIRHPSGRPGRWLGVVTLGAGVLAALLSAPLPAVLVVGGLSLVAAVALTSGSNPAAPLRARGMSARSACIAVVASAAVGVLGVLTALGPSGLLLWLVLLAVGWSLAQDTTLGSRAPTDGGSKDGGPAQTAPGPQPGWPVRVHGRAREAKGPAGLSDSELCWAWRNSYFAAQHAATDPDSLDRISRIRRGYLDEIQRRDPRGFAAWLDAGARAASNPARYWKSDA